MTDFQAALGISQLSRADAGLARRQEIANRYDEAFQDIQGIKNTLSGRKRVSRLSLVRDTSRGSVGIV